MTDAAGILDGAVDLHRHGYPEISDDLRTPMSDIDDVTLCRDAGMRAVVLKSHVWPTLGRAEMINRAVPGITVIPSVTLNRFAGGMEPDVVELAARQGAGVVYLPTASAASDLARGGISQRIAGVIDRYRPDAERGVVITDDDGELTAAALSVLDVFDAYPLLVYSGHVSVAETMAILRTGRLADRYVFAHPDSHSIGASGEDIAEAARLGAFIEICALGAYAPIGRVSFADLARMVRLVGAERCVATSDYFFSWCPPSSAMLQTLADALIAEGLTRHEIELIFRDNPAHLVRHAL
ncbi:hypothetical protein DEU34_2538 [Microbacterium sp. AG1240]|uniref:DUF6282 family protein n=1 Tax=Microbacterium sp. AG1240 TaxID=2183992 RepID=UPI000F0D586E|nr:DUF6282 family protein [Microbacterium sp. AG1240]RKT31468.1 hypothetical protein DEU34_2538 [Microbacterium sp. AG1240]